LIYVRSRRPIVTLGAAAVACAITFGLLAIAVLRVPAGWVAAVALCAGSVGGLAVAVWAGLQLRAWPSGKLGLFRDRLLVVQGRHEMRALWELMDSVTLADASKWPRIKMTDRITISFRNEPPIAFKPAQFGLEATACRDLILKLRDDAVLRQRLREFDSARDLATSPVVAGELFEPRF
jgi:hypothetical protein